MAIPSIDTLIQRTRLDLYARGLIHDLKFAQMEAIKHEQIIIVCPTNNFKACSEKNTQGYMIGLKHLNNKITPLRIKRLKNISLNFNTALEGKAVIYNEAGICQGQGSIILNLASLSKKIVIIHSGRARLSADETI